MIVNQENNPVNFNQLAIFDQMQSSFSKIFNFDIVSEFGYLIMNIQCVQ